MVIRNSNFTKLNKTYLFQEINKRKQAFLAKNPDVKLISLGIGDTSEPIPPPIVQGLMEAAEKLGTREGYSGYGPEQGLSALRERIAEVFYKGTFKPDEIFISDGSKCDIGRLQILFGQKCSISVQDPAYPVYVDTSILTGQGPINYLPCLPENRFFPDLMKAPRTDLFYFCSPNNPTGAVATRDELAQLVNWALANKSIIIYDAAYSSYIQDPSLPRSIYEIPGAEKCAIELGSFSKMAGFTGVRLGWSLVPSTLLYDDGSSVKDDWMRINATFFNGASNIAQGGALTALTPPGLEAVKRQVNFYLENAHILRQTLLDLEYEVYGGDNAPYLWVRFPHKTSWEAFEMLMEEVNIVATPGIGFGQSGEGFIRMSAFCHRETILEAGFRLESHPAKK